MTDIEYDPTAAELEAPGQVEKPQQVEETEVVYLPKKDFTARINRDTYIFNNEVPQRIPRTVANVLLEDPNRGYIKE